MKAIRVSKPGGPEALKLKDVPVPEPGPGQALVKVEAAGVNFIDTYQRSGLYKVPMPFTPGQEAAGVVQSVAAGVKGVKAGDHVAWAGPLGAYAELAVVAADRLVRVPAGVTSAQAAAALLQGMTAHYLVTTTFPLDHHHTCLVHAAAGGVGLLLVQMAELRGARVIGAVGSEEKSVLARQAGADDVVNYRENDLVQFVKTSTRGAGVDVVYDGVGKATWEQSLACLKPRGMMVSFGNASGAVPPFEPLALSAGGSLFLTRPKLADYTVGDELHARAKDVFAWVKAGTLKVRIHAEYPLAEAADAHRALEGRETSGKVLLRP